MTSFLQEVPLSEILSVEANSLPSTFVIKTANLSLNVGLDTQVHNQCGTGHTCSMVHICT